MNTMIFLGGNMFAKKKAEIDLNMRSQSDFLFNSIKWFEILAFCLGTISFLFMFIAIPQLRSFVNLLFDLKIKTNRNAALVSINFYLFGMTFLACAIGLLINSFRLKRRKDHYSIPLIVIGSGAAFIFILFFVLINIHFL